MDSRRVAWIVLLLVLGAIPAGGNIPAFFGELCSNHVRQYAQLREQEYVEFCTELGLAPGDASNNRAFLEVSMLHDLLTGSEA